jgi:tetratricopeptide (TPR) repeat protein
MKKELLLAVIVMTGIGLDAYAHTATKEVQKDDAMLAIESQVRSLILEHNDYQAALKLYADEARKNAGQSYYQEQFSILRRVIKMKKAMEADFDNPADKSDADLKKWNSYYQAVRAWYYAQGFYSKSLELDKTAFEVLKTDAAQLNYFETLVVLNRNAEAKEYLDQAKGPVKDHPVFQTLALLVQARLAPSDAILGQLKLVNPDPRANPASIVYAGCIHQLHHDSKQAFAQLAIALENTAPTQIGATRRMIESMKEFQDCHTDKAYQAALQTQSKIYQSGCTGGSSCNSCSLRTTCPSNQ